MSLEKRVAGRVVKLTLDNQQQAQITFASGDKAFHFSAREAREVAAALLEVAKRVDYVNEALTGPLPSREDICDNNPF